MSRLVYPLALSAFIFTALGSCTNKAVSPPPIEQRETKPTIQISNVVYGSTLVMNTNVEAQVDTTLVDTLFYLYPQTLFDNISLNFTIQAEDGVIQNAIWTLGDDPIRRNGKEVSVDFEEATSRIKATCAVEWIPRITQRVQVDTVTRMFEVVEEPKLFGRYKGISSEGPAPFEVTLGEITTMDGQKDWGITGLFQGFAQSLPTSLHSRGFGLSTAPFPYPQRYQVNGKYYSQPYAIGYLNAAKDSITIKYTYAEYKDQNSFEGIKVQQHVFKGVRL